MKKFIVALAAVAMMATSAYAAEWNFYGSASVQTFWTNTDVIGPGGVNGDTMVTMGNIDSANVIGANVKVSDELTARFEYGNDSAGLNLRHLYGTWNFGAGSLVIGQTDGAFDTDIGNQVYNDGIIGGLACADTGRAPLVMLVFGGLKFNIEAPVANVVDGAVLVGTGEATLPQFNVSYKMNFDNISIELGGAYQTYEYKPTVGAVTYAVDVDSYVAGAQFSGTFGAFGLNASLYTGQNASNLGMGNATTVAYSATNTGGYALFDRGASNTIKDADSFGYALTASFVLNDMLSFGAGYGHVNNEIDMPGAPDNEADTYYINMPITVAPGVVITPEIGTVDYNEVGETDMDYFGAAWKISF